MPIDRLLVYFELATFDWGKPLRQHFCEELKAEEHTPPAA
jgi:hypothetical protein